MFLLVIYAFFSNFLRNYEKAFFEISSNLWKALIINMARFSIEISIDSGQKNSDISHLKKNCCDLNLGENLIIFTFFLFPDSGLNLLNEFDF